LSRAGGTFPARAMVRGIHRSGRFSAVSGSAASPPFAGLCGVRRRTRCCCCRLRWRSRSAIRAVSAISSRRAGPILAGLPILAIFGSVLAVVVRRLVPGVVPAGLLGGPAAPQLLLQRAEGLPVPGRSPGATVFTAHWPPPPRAGAAPRRGAARGTGRRKCCPGVTGGRPVSIRPWPAGG
jgi:hypothetical protein